MTLANAIALGVPALIGLVLYFRAVLHEQDAHDARVLADAKRRRRIETVRRNLRDQHNDPKGARP